MKSPIGSFVSSAVIVVCACAVTPRLSAQDVKAQPSSPEATRKSNVSLDECPFTKPPVPTFTPPGLETVGAPSGGFYFGTPKLSAYLYFGPVGMGEKIAWFIPQAKAAQAEHRLRPALSISLKRLDAPAPVVVTDGNASWSSMPAWWPWFIGSGVDFPTRGCWEITGRLDGETLRFVYQVH